MSPVVQSPLEVQVDGPMESQRLFFSYESIFSIETTAAEVTTASPSDDSKNNHWLYDGRWFLKQNGHWERQELTLQGATPSESDWFKANVNKLPIKPPFELLDLPHQATLPPLRYNPAPDSVLYSTIRVRLAETQSLELPRLLHIGTVTSGGLRARGGWLRNAAELEQLWQDFGLTDPPKTRPGSAVGYYFSGLRNETPFRVRLLYMKQDDEALQVVIELESGETRSAQMTGALLLIEAPVRTTLRVADSSGRVLHLHR